MKWFNCKRRQPYKWPERKTSWSFYRDSLHRRSTQGPCLLPVLKYWLLGASLGPTGPERPGRASLCHSDESFPLSLTVFKVRKLKEAISVIKALCLDWSREQKKSQNWIHLSKTLFPSIYLLGKFRDYKTCPQPPTQQTQDHIVRSDQSRPLPPVSWRLLIS